MLKILNVAVKPSKTRIAAVLVRYHDLLIACDLCVYNNEKLWIRMPEYWNKLSEKIHLVFWDDKETSDCFQAIVLAKVKIFSGLDLEKALAIKQKWIAYRKRIDRNKEKTYSSEEKNPATEVTGKD